MDNKEKEFLQHIGVQMEDVKVPQSLMPERIEKNLNRRQPGKKRRLFYGAAGLAAACLVLVVSGAVLKLSLKRNAEKLIGTALDNTEETDQTVTAEGYHQIYKYLQFQKNMSRGEPKGNVLESQASDMAAPESGNTASSDAGNTAFSDTNVRQEGVGEADYVKSDGFHLFVRKENMHVIEVVTTGKLMESVAEIDLGAELVVKEFYIHDQKLFVLCQNQVDSKEDLTRYMEINRNNTILETFDISNPKNPEKVSQVSQSGRYYTSRFVDGFIYIFSMFDADIASPRNEIASYIPSVQGEFIEEDRIIMPTVPAGQQYMVITSINMKQPGEVVDHKAVFSKSGQCYVSNQNIYIYETQYKWEWEESWKGAANERTNIRKIEYREGKLNPKVQNSIWGGLESSFSIDEYEGNLRTVVTVNGSKGSSSAIYVMDENLAIVGRIEGLADDEQVYSARFMGATGYFVTFRRTDPLFSVDLSDPANPRIIGQLKIPGFSEYLHFYGDGLLLGIGMDVDETTQVVGGVKMSMFDIKDPSHVIEIDKFVLEGVYDSEVFHDYKGVLIDTAENLIGFAAEGNDSEAYYVFGYDQENGFTCKMEQEINGGSSGGARGLYIGDILYVVRGNIIETYSLDNFEKIDDLIL